MTVTANATRTPNRQATYGLGVNSQYTLANRTETNTVVCKVFQNMSSNILDLFMSNLAFTSNARIVPLVMKVGG